MLYSGQNGINNRIFPLAQSLVLLTAGVLLIQIYVQYKSVNAVPFFYFILVCLYKLERFKTVIGQNETDEKLIF